MEVLVWKQRKNNLAPNLWYSLISGTSVRSEPPFLFDLLVCLEVVVGLLYICTVISLSLSLCFYFIF